MTDEGLHEERIPAFHPRARRLPARERERQRESNRQNRVACDVEQDAGNVGDHLVGRSEKSGVSDSRNSSKSRHGHSISLLRIHVDVSAARVGTRRK